MRLADTDRTGFCRRTLVRAWCIAALTVGSIAVLQAHADTVTVPVSAGADDAEERVSDGRMRLGSGDLEMGFDGNTAQTVGLRFRAVTIPPGATIDSAYIQFTADEKDSGPTNLIITGQAADDPPAFSTANFNISTRLPRTAPVLWNSIPPWTSAGDAGPDQQTPDLSAIVQALIGRTGWTSGNAMVFIVEAGAGCIDTTCERTADSRNAGASRAPRLIVDFTSVPTDADLRITKDDSPDPVTTGNALAYYVTVFNDGPLDATGVTVVDTIPSGTVYQNYTASQGTCTFVDNPILDDTLTCDLGALANGASATINILVQAPASGGPITNTATVSGDQPDPDPTNDSAFVTTNINANIGQLCYMVADSGGAGGGDDRLTQIDTASGNETIIGDTSTSFVEAIAWDGAAGTLYAANAGQIGILNTSNGTFTALGNVGSGNGSLGSIALNDIDGLSYDASSGVLWGSHARFGPDLLIQINKATGAVVQNAFGPNTDYVVIQPVGINDVVDDIAVDPVHGVMYASMNAGGSTDRLVRIDTSTGQTTDVAQMVGAQDIEGLGTDSSGQLWGTSGTQNQLWQIDRISGAATNARAIGSGGGSDYESIDCFEISPTVTADVAVAKTVSDTAPPEGDEIVFSVVVTNNGTGTATSVQISDVLPAGVTYVSATTTQGIYDEVDGNWFIGTMKAGQSVTLDITVGVDLGTAGQTITNTAFVAFAGQTDPDPSNDSASAELTVSGEPDIVLMKTVQTLSDPINVTSNPKAIPGAIVMYTIQATNVGDGPVDTDTTTVTDVIPANTALVVTDVDASNPGPVAFVDGTPVSGLSYTFVDLGDLGDDVEFSADGGTTWVYMPTADANDTDTNVTHIRVNPKGAFTSSASGDPSFRLLFRVRID